MAIVEDQRQQQFLYRFLVASGIHPGKIDIELSPPGRGSAKRWVPDNFARKVAACRRRNSKAGTSLIVMMDADQLTLAKCISYLDTAVESANLAKLDPASDPISRLIPKWSIETWILFVVSNGADDPSLTEDKPYKDAKSPDQWTELIPQAAKILFGWTRTGAELPANLLNSLRLGLQEISRALPVER